MTAEVNYRKLHHWLVNNYGKANKCEEVNCEYPHPKRFEWALINGKEYEYNRDNFIMLCPSCHRKYDYSVLTKDEKREWNKWKIGRIPNNIRSILQYTKEGIFINDYPSIKEASEITGILRTAIMANLSRVSKSSGGFVFKYKEA